MKTNVFERVFEYFPGNRGVIRDKHGTLQLCLSHSLDLTQSYLLGVDKASHFRNNALEIEDQQQRAALLIYLSHAGHPAAVLCLQQRWRRLYLVPFDPAYTLHLVNDHPHGCAKHLEHNNLETYVHTCRRAHFHPFATVNTSDNL